MTGPGGPNVGWLASLSPWPVDGFGLQRIHAILEDLGNPERDYPAIHVVGTNGKSTAARTIDALLRADGRRTGSTISPHVASWAERITLDGAEADLEVAVAAVRPVCERHRATQFEAVTAAALMAFTRAGVDVAVVEAGLGGRFDATNVLRSAVVLLTSVGLDHTDVLGGTLEEIAREKLAVAHGVNIVVLPDDTYRHLLPSETTVIHGGAREAAEAFAGRRIDASATVALPGRLEQRAGEIRDGAHNADGVRWLLERLPPSDYVVCASILGDKDVEEMLELLSHAGRTLVATQSTNHRALDAADLARRARPFFDRVESVREPIAAVSRAHELGEPVLVTGSLYLLADLAASDTSET